LDLDCLRGLNIVIPNLVFLDTFKEINLVFQDTFKITNLVSLDMFRTNPYLDFNYFISSSIV